MPGLAERALRISRERYAEFGSTLACEKLAENHGMYLVKETVLKLMTRDSLWIPASYGRRVYISCDSVGPVQENSSR